jgi:hypothetical protein
MVPVASLSLTGAFGWAAIPAWTSVQTVLSLCLVSIELEAPRPAHPTMEEE